MNPSEWEAAIPAGEAVDFKSGRRKQRMMDKAADTDKLPPHSVEAEQGVLGCVMLDPRPSMAICISRIMHGSNAFYDLRHRAIYEVLLEMYDRNSAVDLITLQQALKDRNKLESVGGLVYLASLPDASPSAANIDYYVEILNEKSTLRRIISTCTEAVSKAYEEGNPVSVILDQVEHDIRGICNRDRTTHRLGPTEAVTMFADDLERRWLNDGPSGIITGFHDFDRFNEGLQPGEMFVLGARPSQGKTALGLSVLYQACVIDNIKTDVISLEMPAPRLIRRMAARHCRIPMGNLTHGNLSTEQFEQLAQFGSFISQKPMTFHDFSATGATDQLIASIIRRAAESGTRLVIIDYLQYITAHKRNDREKRHEIGSISTTLKKVAKETGVAMLVLAQLNREADKQDGKSKRPRLPRVSDLAESAQIERDADVIGLIYRDEVSPSIVSLLIRKNRDGISGYNIMLNYNMSYQEFTNAAPDHAIPT